MNWTTSSITADCPTCSANIHLEQPEEHYNPTWPTLRIPKHEDIRDCIVFDRPACPSSETVLNLVPETKLKVLETALYREQVDIYYVRDAFLDLTR